MRPADIGPSGIVDFLGFLEPIYGSVLVPGVKADRPQRPPREDPIEIGIVGLEVDRLDHSQAGLLGRKQLNRQGFSHALSHLALERQDARMEAPEFGDQFLGDPLGEGLLLRIAGQVRERQHGQPDRRSGGLPPEDPIPEVPDIEGEKKNCDGQALGPDLFEDPLLAGDERSGLGKVG
jgi:hypothetical protein